MTTSVRLRPAAAAVAIVAGMVACRPPPAERTAPFRSRPDAVVAGDLRGPFTGRVLDAASRAPVAGAMVYATWSYQRSAPFAVPAGYHEAVVSTDATGHYKIPALAGADVARDAHLVDFALVIYKRGFVAYRSDRRFTDFGPRRDFAQTDNQVELERWRPDYSHARHVRFVGGGGTVAAVTAWEGEAAVAELDPNRVKGPTAPVVGEGPYLVAAQLIKEADIKARTRYDGTFETGPLGDEPDTGSYSSQHFKALGRNESWDVAVRLWRVGPGAALDRYDELRTGLPGVEERDEIASKSLRAVENDIYGVAFLDGQRGVVVLVTCGKSQCSSVDDAVALAEVIYRRVRELWPLDRPSIPTMPGRKP